jgi:putative ABC transport system permease protein
MFVVRSGIKEFGIKKVFGSSGQEILKSLLTNNLLLVLLSGIISVPVTFYFITGWLDNFAYKTPVNWLFFMISFVVAALVVLLTVSVHSWKASQVNPVDALRNE